MAGLVGYNSSEEDSDEDKKEQQRPAGTAAISEIPPSTAQTSSPLPPPPIIGPVPQSALPLGPSLPPTGEGEEGGGGGGGGGEEEEEEEVLPTDRTSPSDNDRALIHHLTLPAVPDLDIPPSPPGSPPSRTSKSFEQFLELKKQGTHFNAKLEQSTSLRNPSIMDKLMDFAELEGLKQYETTLSPDLWNPAAFPEAAFFDRLRKTREKIAKEREDERASGTRTTIDFVPPTMASPQLPGGLAKADKGRSRWK
ncbi:hypothetical protein L249_3486 [Ophiocordyceps polyrhachis-furcata BCC 54312]|uniref:HCNGP-like protein n=1 Tax=Ophiocordyceps polyrhachis-furcata BCC 54312 TaxID=1330021 RepID=A0A367LMM0_9HYPO|nr:hypothetical protein L249_3486 [Ophiocordyceps polyrhachis-furcata BCC 54312]